MAAMAGRATECAVTDPVAGIDRDHVRLWRHQSPSTAADRLNRVLSSPGGYPNLVRTSSHAEDDSRTTVAGERKLGQVTKVASRSISITYVPADCGSIIPGKSKAPKAFQDVGIAVRLTEAGVSSVTEHHALDAPPPYESTPFPPCGGRSADLKISVCQRVPHALR